MNVTQLVGVRRDKHSTAYERTAKIKEDDGYYLILTACDFLIECLPQEQRTIERLMQINKKVENFISGYFAKLIQTAQEEATLAANVVPTGSSIPTEPTATTAVQTQTPAASSAPTELTATTAVPTYTVVATAPSTQKSDGHEKVIGEGKVVDSAATDHELDDAPPIQGDGDVEMTTTEEAPVTSKPSKSPEELKLESQKGYKESEPKQPKQEHSTPEKSRSKNKKSKTVESEKATSEKATSKRSELPTSAKQSSKISRGHSFEGDGLNKKDKLSLVAQNDPGAFIDFLLDSPGRSSAATLPKEQQDKKSKKHHRRKRGTVQSTDQKSTGDTSGVVGKIEPIAVAGTNKSDNDPVVDDLALHKIPETAKPVIQIPPSPPPPKIVDEQQDRVEQVKQQLRNTHQTTNAPLTGNTKPGPLEQVLADPSGMKTDTPGFHLQLPMHTGPKSGQKRGTSPHPEYTPTKKQKHDTTAQE